MPGVTTPLTGVAEPQKAYGATSVTRRNRGKKGKKAPAVLPAKSVTTKTLDGVATTVNTTPKSAFGMAEPPGGWYGPFGFLRMVSYMFLFWSALMLTTFMYGLLVKEHIWSLAFCLILSAASLMAAAAAYSHEGLANQVTRMAKHSAEYSALNDDFERQTSDLEDVTSKLQDLLKDKAQTLEEFKAQMGKMDQLSSLNQISVVTRSFIDAQMLQYARDGGGSDSDGILTNSEVRDFLLSAKTTFKERIPDFDLGDLARLSFFPGISLTEVNLLLATVDTDFPEEKELFLQLLYFFLNPHDQDVEGLKEGLADHLKDNEIFGKGALDAEIDRLLAITPKDGKYVEYGGQQRHTHCRVPVPQTKKLLGEVLLTFMKEDDNDLGISDDEEEEEKED